MIARKQKFDGTQNVTLKFKLQKSYQCPEAKNKQNTCSLYKRLNCIQDSETYKSLYLYLYPILRRVDTLYQKLKCLQPDTLKTTLSKSLYIQIYSIII